MSPWFRTLIPSPGPVEASLTPGVAVTLARQLDDAVGTEGWSEWVAEKVLTGLEAVLKEGRERMGLASMSTLQEPLPASHKPRW